MVKLNYRSVGNNAVSDLTKASTAAKRLKNTALSV